MKATHHFKHKGRFACRLENGLYLLSQDTMRMALCEKVQVGFKVIREDLIGGTMMRTTDEFLECAEAFSPRPGEIPEWDEATAAMAAMQKKQTGNKEKARLLAMQIKEEVGMSQHSVERVAEIIRNALDGKDRTEVSTKRLIATLVRVNSDGDTYVSRSFTKIDDEAIATIRGCIAEDNECTFTPEENESCYLPAMNTLKEDLADIDKETEFDFDHEGFPIWEYNDEVEVITYMIHLSILD